MCPSLPVFFARPVRVGFFEPCQRMDALRARLQWLMGLRVTFVTLMLGGAALALHRGAHKEDSSPAE